MDPSACSSPAGKQSLSHFSEEDDDTVVTPPKGDKSVLSRSIIQEKTLKFRFPPTQHGNNGNVHPLVLHAHWMYEVQMAFGDEVKFFDNSNRKVGKLDTLGITQEAQEQRFSVHTANAGNRRNDDSQDHRPNTQYRPNRFILHRIQTKFTLSEIKNAPNVANLMQKYDFYVNDHKWSETDWGTIQLGFLYGIDPQFYDPDHATCKVQEIFKRNVPRAKVPKFRLVYCSPKVQSSKGSNRSVRTKAYAIETLRNDRDAMISMLKQA